MKRRYWILLVVVLALAVVYFYSTNPERHADMFVAMYGDHIEKSMLAGDGVPENLGCRSVSKWKGENPMTEFLLSGWGIGSGTRYYGCYYSPDDVPLPFQNSGAKLTPTGPDSWEWKGKGDNRGSTRKIRDCWYYFDASF